jgi:FdhD protein
MIKKTKIKKHLGNDFADQEDLIIKEHRANIFVNGAHYISLMCLPQHLDELAVGFLFAEGLIGAYADVLKIGSDDTGDIFVDIRNTHAAKTAARVVISGFGQGSVNLPFFNYENLPAITGPLKISSQEVIKMAASFNKRSELFLKTGAVHSAALVLPDGTDLFYEDIGRHNAVDKIIGKALRSALSIKNGILLTSGRISSEILIKAAGLGIPVLISISAPTDLAVELARKMNMTLIGFARGDSFNVYAGEGRVVQ